jgi:hypothetical protein
MSARPAPVPAEWEPRLATDLAELLAAAEQLADGGEMHELPEGFAEALAALAAARAPR